MTLKSWRPTSMVKRIWSQLRLMMMGNFKSTCLVKIRLAPISFSLVHSRWTVDVSRLLWVGEWHQCDGCGWYFLACCFYLDTAMKYVDSHRSELGAMQNRFDTPLTTLKMFMKTWRPQTNSRSKIHRLRRNGSDAKSSKFCSKLAPLFWLKRSKHLTLP